MLGAMGIKFVSKEELEAQRKQVEAARLAREKAEAEERRAHGERKKERLASGEAAWVAPALERRLKHREHREDREDRERIEHREDREHKEKLSKKKTKKKEKHKQRHSDRHATDCHTRDESGSESSDSGELPPADGEVRGCGPSAVPKQSDRDAAGLGFMMQPAARSSGAKRLDGHRIGDTGRSLETKPTADEAARERARLERELNPYASAGKDTSTWTRDGVACFSHVANGGDKSSSSWAGAPPLRNPAGTDGGASWRDKQLLRAVEHARDAQQSLQQVCLDRFGTLDSLADMQRIHERLEKGQDVGGTKSGRAHLQAISARQREHRRLEGSDGRTAPSGMLRPKLSGSLSWGAKDSKRGSDDASQGAGEVGAVSNNFQNDGKFLTEFLEKHHVDSSSGIAVPKPFREAVQIEPHTESPTSARSVTISQLPGAGSKGDKPANLGKSDAERAADRAATLKADAEKAAQRRAFLDGSGKEIGEAVSSHDLESPVCEEVIGSRTQAGEERRDCSLEVPCTDSAGLRQRARSQVQAEVSTAESTSQSSLDANQLMAQALRAKMMGKTAEFERLQAIAKAVTPSPAPREEVTDRAPVDVKHSGGLVEVLIPESTVGIIIGKGGSTIDAMQRESGARIQLLKEPDPESGQRVVVLRGLPTNVDKAQALLEEKLNESAEREARRGGYKVSKREAKRARDRPPQTRVEQVPEFDVKTGELKIVERKVKVDEVDGLHVASADPREGASTKRPKTVQRYDRETGERTKFFREDDTDIPLSSMVAEARRGAGKGIDAHYADNVARMGRKYKGPTSADDEYDYDEGIQMHESRLSRKSEAQRMKSERSSAAAAERRISSLEEQAQRRFNDRKHLIIALGEHVFLRLQDQSPIGPGHCVIEPIEHVASHVDALDEVAQEARNFQKCLVRMFEKRGAQPVFFETYLTHGSGAGVPSRSTMAIECVPLPQRDAAGAPGYCKKAILECDEEWAQHKKLYDTSGCVRGTVPPGFAYFDVSFGLQAGYAHVIEDEAGWNLDFGRHTLEGLLEMEDAGIPLRRHRKLPFEEVQRRVVDFGKAFEPFDWTREL